MPNVRDDRETPLCVGQDGAAYKDDLGKVRTNMFFTGVLDSAISGIEFDLPVRQLPFAHYVIRLIPKSSFRGDAERGTRNPEVVAEIPGSRWRAPRNDVPG
jgi:hypothetical protein